MLITDELRQDQQEIRKSFHQIAKLVSARKNQLAEQDAKGLYEKLRERIESHIYAKEMCLYRGLMERPETKHIAQDFMDQHSESRDALEDMSELDCADADCVKAFRDLRRRFSSHFAEEEMKIFAKLPSLFSEEQDLELVDLFRSLRMKSEIKSQRWSMN